MKVNFLTVPNPGTDPVGFEIAMNANLATLAAAMELVVWRDRRETMLAPLDFARPQNTTEDRPTTMNGYFRWRDDMALTSRPYAIVTTEALGYPMMEATGGFEFSVIFEAMDFAVGTLGGVMYGGLVAYEDALPEAIDFNNPEALGGVFYGGLTDFLYNDGIGGYEAIDFINPEGLGGVFYGGLVTYANYPIEGIDMNVTALGGTFS